MAHWNGSILSSSLNPLRHPILGCLWVALLPGCDEGPNPTSDLSPVPLEASIGQTYASTDDPGVLVGPFDVEVSSDGFVYVSQPQLAEVTVFAPTGAYSHTVGRRGRGPGEFQNPGAVRFLADTLTVLEFGTGISLLSPDGEYYDRVSFMLDAPPGRPFPMAPIALLADGNVGCFSPLSPSTVLLSEGIDSQFWIKATRDGVVLDTLISQPVDGAYALVEVPGARKLTLNHPLAWNDLNAVPPDGSQFVAVDRSSGFDSPQPVFRVYRIDLAGDTTHAREFRYPPVPLTSEEKVRISEGIAQRQAEGSNMSVARLAEIVEDEIRWPPHLPPVSRVVVGADGAIWLQREPVPGDSVRWDILAPNLEPRGHVFLPTSFDVKRVSGESVWGVQTDEMDVPSILRIDLHRARKDEEGRAPPNNVQAGRTGRRYALSRSNP